MSKVEIDWAEFEEKCKGCINETVKCRLESCCLCQDYSCPCFGCNAHEQYVSKLRKGDPDV